MRGFSSKRILVVLIIALAVCLWVQMDVTFAQVVKAEKPVANKITPIPKSDDTFTKEEKQSIVNELRRELLDDRADTIDWWLTGIAIFFAALGVVGYISFRNLQDEARRSADAAKEHAEEAKKLVEEIEKAGKGVLETFGEQGKQVLKLIGDEGQEVIKLVGLKGKELLEEIREYRDKSKALLDETAESFASATEKERRTVENTLEDPQSSPMEKAVARALSLQEQDKKDEAIEAWRNIAKLMEGIDDDLAAGARFSIGYLLGQQGKHGEAIAAFDEAIRLRPDGSASAYMNRGNGKSALSQFEDAIADYDKALNLRPDYALAYYNRGNSKGSLCLYQEAIADYDEALSLNPEITDDAYSNRGNAKLVLGYPEDAIADHSRAISLNPANLIAYAGRGHSFVLLGEIEAARHDFEKVRDLARAIGEEKMATDAEQELKNLDER